MYLICVDVYVFIDVYDNYDVRNRYMYAYTAHRSTGIC